MGISALADASNLTEAALHRLIRGQTRVPRAGTLAKLATALDVDVSYFGEGNAHLVDDEKVALVDLERDYGPSVRAGLQLGSRRTLWLAYDTASDDRYDPETLVARVADREPKLSKPFIALRRQIEDYNSKLQADRSLGNPYFDGPTFCLSRFAIDRSSDGHERKNLSVEFSRSRYANNKTAKSGSAANLRRKALQAFNFQDQPIEWLASGVGVAVVVFCDDGSKFVAAQRSEGEQFRSREFDVSVVEGINPVKDRRSPESDTIHVVDVIRRAVSAELGFTPELDSIYPIGFGVDLEYYQWNFIAYVNAPYSFRQIEDFWQTADEKEETIGLRAVDTTPTAAAGFLRDNTVWSCGMAALYFSLLKKIGPDIAWRDQFHAAFDGLV